MKKFLLFVSLSIAFALTASPQSAFTTDADDVIGKGNIKTITFIGTVEYDDTLFSSPFHLLDCEPDFDFWHYVSTPDTAALTVKYQWRAFDDVWVTKDSILVGDSSYTMIATRDTITYYPLELRLMYIGTDQNGTATTFNSRIRAKLKDD
jgi:hypothetical protein